jgi:replicative DNA helicase
MNANIKPFQKAADSTTAEQSVIGCVLLDNDSIDRIGDLQPAHFYSREHQAVFAEMRRQISAGRTCDVITVYEALHAQVADCMPYLHACSSSVGSAANIHRYAETVIDRALKREISKVGGEMQELQASMEPAGEIINRMASKLEALAHAKTDEEPELLADSLVSYVELLTAREEGTIKPIQTGFADLDKQLGGGIDRGTLTIVAGRPSMGKTALGLGVARNVSEWGTALFLSMEMPKASVNDRNISALGKIPLSWLRMPRSKTEEDQARWRSVTHAFNRAQDLNLYIDDQTGLSLLKIRAKARSVKRRRGLDAIVVDQLSFITGSDSDKLHEAVGEYTRGMLAIARELNVAVVLLCQLNRDLEKRPNKRPQMSDLALSGSIEQDAENIIFLYRDEIYNPDSRDKGIAEIITGKQRQGQPGTVGLAYIGDQTRFEDLTNAWAPDAQAGNTRSRASRFEA